MALFVFLQILSALGLQSYEWMPRWNYCCHFPFGPTILQCHACSYERLHNFSRQRPCSTWFSAYFSGIMLPSLAYLFFWNLWCLHWPSLALPWCPWKGPRTRKLPSCTPYPCRLHTNLRRHAPREVCTALRQAARTDHHWAFAAFWALPSCERNRPIRVSNLYHDPVRLDPLGGKPPL